MEYNIKWNGRTIDNTGRHHLRWSAKRTRARRYLSCPGGCLEFRSAAIACLLFVAVEISPFRSPLFPSKQLNDEDFQYT